MRTALLLCLVCLRVGAVTNYIACTYSALTNAIAGVSESDIIQLGGGSDTLLAPIVIDNGKSFIIRGSGTNQSTLISGNFATAIQWKSCSGNSGYGFQDLNLVGHSGNTFGLLSFGGNIPSTPLTAQFRLTRLQMTNTIGRAIFTSADAFGCIDHCYFETHGSGAREPFTFLGNQNRSWTNANPLGTTNVVCVEYCTILNEALGGGNGWVDSYDGAQWLWRYNIVKNASPGGCHGWDSQPTSCRTWEIYGNVFTNWLTTVLPIELRGGTGVCFSNLCYGASDFVELAYYRSCAEAHLGTVNSLGVPGANFYLQTNSTSPVFTQGIPTNNPSDGAVTIVGFQDSGRYLWKNTLSAAGNVKIGATLKESITNLFLALNKDPTSAGTAYFATTVTNFDFRGVSTDGTNIVLTCLRDGPGAMGYPANQQPGVIQSYPYTNTQVLLPAYSWSNLNNGTNIGFSLKDDSSACNHAITNWVQLNRDYFNDTPMPMYVPLVLPHPLDVDPVPPPPAPPYIFLPQYSKIKTP